MVILVLPLLFVPPVGNEGRRPTPGEVLSRAHRSVGDVHGELGPGLEEKKRESALRVALRQLYESQQCDS